MPDRPPDIAISAVVLAHAEGRLLHPCLISFDRAIAAAESAGLAVERLLVLADATATTRRWAECMRPPGWRLLAIADSDPGRAKNAAIGEARGTHVALLHGDDLTCASWLLRAHAAAAAAETAVWHPELAIRFGEIGESTVHFHPDGAASAYDYAALSDANPYSAGVFAPRALFARVPYPEGDPARGFAFTDWHWNCRVVGAGIHHRIVPETWHYERLHTDGTNLTARWAAAKARIGPTGLFEGAGRALLKASARP